MVWSAVVGLYQVPSVVQSIQNTLCSLGSVTFPGTYNILLFYAFILPRAAVRKRNGENKRFMTSSWHYKFVIIDPYLPRIWGCFAVKLVLWLSWRFAFHRSVRSRRSWMQNVKLGITPWYVRVLIYAMLSTPSAQTKYKTIGQQEDTPLIRTRQNSIKM